MRDSQLTTYLETWPGLIGGMISHGKPQIASSLPGILETGPHLSRYFLSPKAASGILRRAAKRGRVLPEALQAALEALAQSAPSEATGREVAGA